MLGSKPEIISDMNHIYINKVNNIYEYNLPNDILNPSKHTQNMNFQYSPILLGCMNTSRGRANI